MIFTVLAAIIGTVFYAGVIVRDKRRAKRSRRDDEACIQARVQSVERFESLCVDKEGSLEFRNMFPMNREFSVQVCREATAILHSIPGLENAPAIIPTTASSQRFFLAAFLHFVPTGKAYHNWVIAEGNKPFGMSVEDAEKVMAWGMEEMKRHGVLANIYKTWDRYDRLMYGWTIPVGARKWCYVNDQSKVFKC